MTEDNKKDKKKEKETIKDRHDKIQTAILMEINNLLMDLNEKIDESHEELLEELGHKVDIPGYYKEDEELQKIRQKTGFDKEEDNFYDVTDTITTAQATDPGDFENANYNRERIFQVLDRYANSIYVANDGTDDLFVRISHHGTTTFSREARIAPGDAKKYYRVYELRLRSPTQGLPYRVSEYKLCCKTVFVYGSRGAQLQQDVSRYLITIDTVHSKIHQGVTFSIGDIDIGINIITPKRYLIITPNTSARAHIVFTVETEPGAKFEFFEDTTVTANGTALSPINYKRDSSTTSVLQVFKDPTVTVDANRIFLWQSGTTTAGGKVGGMIKHEDEFILKQNAKYQVKITPLSNNTTVFIHIDWYEV